MMRNELERLSVPYGESEVLTSERTTEGERVTKCERTKQQKRVMQKERTTEWERVKQSQCTKRRKRVIMPERTIYIERTSPWKEKLWRNQL
jgi:hypothetical protein